MRFGAFSEPPNFKPLPKMRVSHTHLCTSAPPINVARGNREIMSEVNLDNPQEEGKEAKESENAGTETVTDDDTKTLDEVTEEKQLDEAEPAEQSDQPPPLDTEEGGIERQTDDLSDLMQGEVKDGSDGAKAEDESSKETETEDIKEGEKEQLAGGSEETDRKEGEGATNKPEEEVEATGENINKTEEVEGEDVKSGEEVGETRRVPSILIMNEEGEEMVYLPF